ncbi:MAG: hypothetical protein Q8O40_09885 [Chloroflexota bacterium]|nr:hypothetical protein [Chloroflexota bacterium]
MNNVQALTTIPRFAVGFFTAGNEGVQAVATELDGELTDQARREGKFSKARVNYLPVPLPPGGYLYDCSHCRFWQGPHRCRIVGQPGDSFGGEAIYPWHYCTLWVPPEGEPVLQWVVRLLRPDLATRKTEVVL